MANFMGSDSINIEFPFLSRTLQLVQLTGEKLLLLLLLIRPQSLWMHLRNPSGVINGNTNFGRSSYQNFPNASRCNGGYRDLCYRLDGMWSSVAWYANGHPRPATARPLSTSSGHNANNWSARDQYQQPTAHGMGMNTHRSASGILPSAPLVSRMYRTNHICGLRNKFGYGQGHILVDRKHDPSNQRNVFSDAS